MTGDTMGTGLVRPMERPPSSLVSLHPSRDQEQAQEGKKNRWAAAGQAVLNPSLQKEQGFPNSMGRSHFPRSVLAISILPGMLLTWGICLLLLSRGLTFLMSLLGMAMWDLQASVCANICL